MGCGTIKTSESSEQYDDNINPSELLPEVHFNKKSNISNIEEQKSIHSSIQNDKKSEKNENSLKISSKSNKKSKNSKNSIKSIIINKKLEESIKIKNKDNESSNKINSELNNNNSSSNLKSLTERESENANKKEEKILESEINNSKNINKSNSNSSKSKNESKKESISISNYENKNKNEEKESLLRKKAYTTDKLPHSNANISFYSNNEEKLPKVVQSSELSGGYLDKKFLEIELKANRYETIFPIWISKEEEIDFIISGKWNINNEIECDSRGINIQNDENYENGENKNTFNDGALVGIILKGKPFLIYNGLKYISDISGPLILKMNINSLWSKEQPQGVLKIKIYGAQKIENVTDLDEKIGWWKQLRNIEFSNKDQIPNYELDNNEKSIIILLNKLRHDSKLFSSQYLDNYQRLTPTTKKIYNQFIENTEQFIPFKINLSVIKLLTKFFGVFINEYNKKNVKEEDWTYILKSENYLQKFLEESFNNKKKIFVSIIRYYEENPFYLGLRILFRDNIRNNMLSYNFEEMSIINLFNNLRKDGKKIYYCIVVLSNQNGNDKVYYDLNKNIEQFIEDEKKLEVHLSTSRQYRKL